MTMPEADRLPPLSSTEHDPLGFELCLMGARAYPALAYPPLPLP